MAGRLVSLARWAAVPMVALAGATVMQAVVFLPFDAVVCGVMGRCGGAETWAAKTVTSVFMGFAFVGLARWAAPRAKSPTSLVALAAVVYWGARLMAAAFAKGFSVWLFAMGAAGIVGGVWPPFWATGRPRVSGALPNGRMQLTSGRGRRPSRVLHSALRAADPGFGRQMDRGLTA